MSSENRAETAEAMNFNTQKAVMANDYFPNPTINNGNISTTKNLVR